LTNTPKIYIEICKGSLNNGAVKTGYLFLNYILSFLQLHVYALSFCKRMKLYPYLSAYTTVNSYQVKNLKNTKVTE
jgi:hypothetical protein